MLRGEHVYLFFYVLSHSLCFGKRMDDGTWGTGWEEPDGVLVVLLLCFEMWLDGGCRLAGWDEV